jgi:hypothetical protein
MDLFSFSISLLHIHFLKKKIGFIVFFLIFLFIRLSWSHNLACGFSKLTQLSSHLSFSFFFLWDSFMLLIFFISFFNIWFVENWPTWFFYIWCFQSNGPGHKFYKLTRFSIKFFFIIFFPSHNLTLIFIKIEFHDFLYFFYVRFSWSHNLTRRFKGLTWAGSGLLLTYNCYFFILLYVRILFFNFTLLYLVCWELGFEVFSNLLLLVKWLGSQA